MGAVLLVFPHQLFEEHPGLSERPDTVVLIEDSLFFGDAIYPVRFHKQKLWLHRVSMKRYEQRLKDRGLDVVYCDYDPGASLLQTLERVRATDSDEFVLVDPTDYVLEMRVKRDCQRLGNACRFLESPNFINSRETNREYRAGKKRWYMADFYKFQRKRLDVLVADGEPVGGKWSFDRENRKKVPRKELGSLPELRMIEPDEFDLDARAYVEKRFAENPGSIDTLYYPTTYAGVVDWFDHFLEERFDLFGVYEDAILEGESWLWHSVLTPMLNVGLISPKNIVERTLRFAEEHDVPLNSLEGFLRQVIGWREFMRATYEDLGVEMRNANFWQHERTIPASFYSGTTGIVPIDDTIQRILKTGYCHHIERLMVLGGFMFLCEFEPNEIYRWFMEMFVDSYDWVMVPNVYAMSQNADSGLITTKPYFSGSSYIRKMSHHKKADWAETWDALYWRWIINHSADLAKNPRWAMMCSMARKMDSEVRDRHLSIADAYLSSLS